ncbi:MAG TPA: hypothetical protein VEF04_17365 [Blastocatellia bacterium]|nr:hypothetical protein [Blastocatellia bacterium]
MASRKPLVIISGQPQEIPAADQIPAAQVPLGSGLGTSGGNIINKLTTNVFGANSADNPYAWSYGRGIGPSSANKLHFETGATPYDPNGTWSKWSWPVTNSGEVRSTQYAAHWLTLWVPYYNAAGPTLQWTDSVGVNGAQWACWIPGDNFDTTHDVLEVRMWRVQNPTSSDTYIGGILRLNTANDPGSRYRLYLTQGTGVNFATLPTTISTGFGLIDKNVPMYCYLVTDGTGYFTCRVTGVDVPYAPSTATYLNLGSPWTGGNIKTVRWNWKVPPAGACYTHFDWMEAV